VIIPVRDDRAGLERCLAALEGQDYPSASYEVVVVDNGSREPVDDLVSAFPHATTVLEPRPGSYRARNRGIDAGRGDVFAFLDADCIPNREWLRRGIECLTRARESAAAAGRIDVVPRDPTRRSSAELYEMYHAFPQERYVEQMHFGATANLFTWRVVVDDVGAFDGDLASGGDREWGYRVHSAGKMLVFCPEAVVCHPARASWRALRTKFRRVYEGARALNERGVGSARANRPRLLPPVRSVTRALVVGRDGVHTPPDRVRYASALLLARVLQWWAWSLARLTAGRRRRSAIGAAALRQED
jgi:glycosyltransferase involved in cell wall biosynthesis